MKNILSVRNFVILFLFLVIGIFSFYKLDFHTTDAGLAAVAVTPPVKIKSFSINGVVGNSNGSSQVVSVVNADTLTLKWETENAVSCYGQTNVGLLNSVWNYKVKIPVNSSGYKIKAVLGGGNTYYISCYGKNGPYAYASVHVNVLASLPTAISNVSLSYGTFSDTTRNFPVTIVPNVSNLPYRYVVLITDANQKTIGGASLSSSAGGNTTYNWNVPATFGTTSKFNIDVYLYTSSGDLKQVAGITRNGVTLK